MLFRSKFTDLFDQCLKIQCQLKGICSAEEFDAFKQEIYYKFQEDNNFAELKESELLTNRLNLLSAVDPYKGVYYSQEWIQKKILQLTDEDIKEIKQQIDQEIADGLYPDPKAAMDPTMGGDPSLGGDPTQQDQSGDQGQEDVAPQQTNQKQPDKSKNSSGDNPYYEN